MSNTFTATGAPRRFTACKDCKRRGYLVQGFIAVPCPNGCKVNSTGARRFSEQNAVEKRFDEVKRGEW